MAQAIQPDARGDWLRMLGGVVFALGAVILFARKGDDWAAFPLLIVVAVPCVVVFGLGALGALATGEVARWHAVLMVAGVLLSGFAFGQLWDVVGVNTETSGFGFLTFVCVAGLAAFASFGVGAAYQALLVALAGIAAWLFLFDMILDDPGATTFRWLLLVLCLAYAAVAFALREREAPQAPEFVTAAGIAAVLVGVIGVLAQAGDAIGPLFLGGTGGETEGQSFVWDVWLLLISLALVAYGAVVHARRRRSLRRPTTCEAKAFSIRWRLAHALRRCRPCRPNPVRRRRRDRRGRARPPRRMAARLWRDRAGRHRDDGRGAEPERRRAPVRDRDPRGGERRARAGDGGGVERDAGPLDRAGGGRRGGGRWRAHAAAAVRLRGRRARDRGLLPRGCRVGRAADHGLQQPEGERYGHAARADRAAGRDRRRGGDQGVLRRRAPARGAAERDRGLRGARGRRRLGARGLLRRRHRLDLGCRERGAAGMR